MHDSVMLCIVGVLYYSGIFCKQACQLDCAAEPEWEKLESREKEKEPEIRGLRSVHQAYLPTYLLVKVGAENLKQVHPLCLLSYLTFKLVAVASFIADP